MAMSHFFVWPAVKSCFHGKSNTMQILIRIRVYIYDHHVRKGLSGAYLRVYANIIQFLFESC
jgi:hypothetical protein